MRFSIRVQYGLQAMLELAPQYGGGPMQIRDIARNQKIPVRYLEQLLLVLKRMGIVVSTRGKNGGYAMQRHPSDVPLLEIIEAFEGPIELTSRKMKQLPVLFETFSQIENVIKKQLSELTVEDLVLKKRQKDRAYTYNI